MTEEERNEKHERMDIAAFFLKALGESLLDAAEMINPELFPDRTERDILKIIEEANKKAPVEVPEQSVEPEPVVSESASPEPVVEEEPSKDICIETATRAELKVEAERLGIETKGKRAKTLREEIALKGDNIVEKNDLEKEGSPEETVEKSEKKGGKKSPKEVSDKRKRIMQLFKMYGDNLETDENCPRNCDDCLDGIVTTCFVDIESALNAK